MIGKKEGGRLAFSVTAEEVWLGPGTVEKRTADRASSGEGIAGLLHSLMMLAK